MLSAVVPAGSAGSSESPPPQPAARTAVARTAERTSTRRTSVAEGSRSVGRSTTPRAAAARLVRALPQRFRTRPHARAVAPHDLETELGPRLRCRPRRRSATSRAVLAAPSRLDLDAVPLAEQVGERAFSARSAPALDHAQSVQVAAAGDRARSARRSPQRARDPSRRTPRRSPRRTRSRRSASRSPARARSSRPLSPSGPRSRGVCRRWQGRHRRPRARLAAGPRLQQPSALPSASSGRRR